jgi:hypothetical protein
MEYANMKKGTSSVPLIMGIIGAVLMLPALFCSACAAGVASGLGSGSGTGTLMVIGVLPIGLGIVGGVMGKSKPSLSMILLLVAAALTLIGWILVAFTSMFHLFALVLFIVGAIVAKTQKMEE